MPELAAPRALPQHALSRPGTARRARYTFPVSTKRSIVLRRDAHGPTSSLPAPRTASEAEARGFGFGLGLRLGLGLGLGLLTLTLALTPTLTLTRSGRSCCSPSRRRDSRRGPQPAA